MANYVGIVDRAIEGAIIDKSVKKRTIRAVWSTDETDHYRTAFVQTGIDTSVFRENPVIAWEHCKSAARGTLPIANAVDWGVDRYKGKNALIGAAKFWDDEFSNARFEDYATGRLKGWSIRTIPQDASPPTAAERRARPDWGQAEVVYRSTTLIEVSATTLPGNKSTLTIGVERSAGGSAHGPMSPAALRRALEEHSARNERIRRDVMRAVPGILAQAFEGLSDDELRALIRRRGLEIEAERLESILANRADAKERARLYSRQSIRG